jgi:hypothetical protein
LMKNLMNATKFKNENHIRNQLRHIGGSFNKHNGQKQSRSTHINAV